MALSVTAVKWPSGQEELVDENAMARRVVLEINGDGAGGTLTYHPRGTRCVVAVSNDPAYAAPTIVAPSGTTPGYLSIVVSASLANNAKRYITLWYV